METFRLETLASWRDLRFDDDMEGLIKAFRNPGGVDEDGERHHGFAISMIAISNLKVLRLAGNME